MDKSFREKLRFNGDNNPPTERENWRQALVLLSESTNTSTASSASLQVPSLLNKQTETAYLEWSIAEESHSTLVILIPYFVDNCVTYRIPSFNHLLNHVSLNDFDSAWVNFFIAHCYHDNAKVTLSGQNIDTILWALAQANRLRFASTAIELGLPLQLKARLRFSEEWKLWTLDAELMTENAEVITPESLDFIAQSGLAIYDGTLFPLYKGAAWIAQLLANGAWFITQENLSEALYQLARCIQDGTFLQHLGEVHCIQKNPVPVVYLRAKQFDAQTKITLYLAYRYDDHEVFSVWHSQEDISIPIGFKPDSETCILYFRQDVSENEALMLIKEQPDIAFIANKRAFMVKVSILWQLIHDFLKKKWEVWAEKQKIEELSSFGVNIESGIGWFDIQSLDTHTNQRIDPLQLIRYLKRKSLFIQLGNNKICVLPERWIAQLTQFLDIGQSEAQNGWCFSSMYAPEVNAAIGDELGFEADDAFQAVVNKIRSFESVVALTQPEGLRAILRPYQLQGLTWLNLLCDIHVGGILADDMGLGKTVQILALLQHRLVNQPNLTPQTVLVISPKSVQSHWAAQINNLIPRLPCRILNTHDVLIGEHHSTQHQLLLASYGLIRHHIEALSSRRFDLLILDEAQMIKNQFSRTTQAIKQLNAAQRFALTGTPIENRFEELACIFSFLNPHAPLNLNAVTSTPDAVRDLVQKALHPFVLRRLKEDVLPDLPVKCVEKITLPMTQTQEALYQKLLTIYRDEITKLEASDDLPTEADKTFLLEGLLRLRQVATHPQQLLDEKFQTCSSNKLLYLCEHIPILIEKGHRIVVFSQFLGALKNASENLRSLSIRHSYIDGKTIDREQEFALFQSNPAIKVLLVSLRVGGVGIDLTHTDVCILLDPWWNDAVEKQAIDRLHRFGQKKPVTVLRLLSENSIEEKMEILKHNKSELADAIGTTHPDFLNHLQWCDFTEIFK